MYLASLTSSVYHGPSPTREVYEAKCPIVASGRDLLAMGDGVPTTKDDVALALLYMSKTLFHPVFDCVTFSSLTLITIRQWAESSSGIDNQYTLLYGTSLVAQMVKHLSAQGSRPSCPDQEGRKGSEEGVPENLGVLLSF